MKKLEDFTPTPMLLKVQGLKYKAAIFPIGLVLAGFVIYSFYENDYVKFSSILGLLLYLVIIYLHRVYRPMPPEETNVFLSPVHGTIVAIEDGKVVIEKKTLNYIDIRVPMEGMQIEKVNEMVYAFEGSGIECELTGNRIRVFADDITMKGRMIGAAVGKCHVVLQFPRDWLIELPVGDKVIAGESIIGSLN